MFDSSRSTATTIRRHSVVAALLLAAAAGHGASAIDAEEGLGTTGAPVASPALDAEPEPHEECYEFDVLPDGVSIDGCWECDTDYHFGWSFWCVDVTLSCEDEDDNSLTIDVTDAAGFC